MNLGNTLYAKMLQHRLQQQQLDQQNYQQAMEVANQNAMEAAQLEDREFERSKELAKLQGETAAMLDRPDPDFEDGELNPYARHARNAWRRDTAEKLAARDFQRQKHEQDLQAKMFGITYPHSDEVQGRKHGYAVDLDAEKRAHELAMRLKLGQLKRDENGQPLGIEKQFPGTHAMIDDLGRMLEDATLQRGLRGQRFNQLYGYVMHLRNQALSQGLDDNWVNSKLIEEYGPGGVSAEINRISAIPDYHAQDTTINTGSKQNASYADPQQDSTSERTDEDGAAIDAALNRAKGAQP